MSINFHAIRGVLLDVDGTLWRGSEAVPGLTDFFAFLRKRAIGIRIITNNALRPASYYREKLAAFGIAVDTNEILTSARATGDYLAQTLPPQAPVYVIGEAGLLAAVRAAGMRVMPDATTPVAAVVVGGDRCLTYTKIKHAVLLLQRGATLIGTNPDLLIPTVSGLAPETGVTLAALTAATGVTPTIIGKPARWLFSAALAQLDLTPSQALMIGDRLDTDILGAHQLGIRTVLVTTGIDSAADATNQSIEPNLIAAHLDAVLQTWRNACILPNNI